MSPSLPPYGSGSDAVQHSLEEREGRHDARRRWAEERRAHDAELAALTRRQLHLMAQGAEARAGLLRAEQL
eukprot:gene53566-14701_t